MLWTMTVSTYGDLSQLAVLPLATDLLVPFSGLTVFIVQASDFRVHVYISIIECLRATCNISHFTLFDFGSWLEISSCPLFAKFSL
jgi:hypothetical protein